VVAPSEHLKKRFQHAQGLLLFPMVSEARGKFFFLLVPDARVTFMLRCRSGLFILSAVAEMAGGGASVRYIFGVTGAAQTTFVCLTGGRRHPLSYQARLGGGVVSCRPLTEGDRL
jgi:hypothetical protein